MVENWQELYIMKYIDKLEIMEIKNESY